MPHIKPRDSSFLMLKIMMKFEPFLLKSNTKSYVLYWMVMLLMTLGDP